MRETWVWSLGQEDPLKKGTAILAWRTPWTEEPGEWQLMGSVTHHWVTFTFPFTFAPSVDLCCWHEINILNFWLLSPLVLVLCLPSEIFLRKYLCLFPLQSTLAGFGSRLEESLFLSLKGRLLQDHPPPPKQQLTIIRQLAAFPDVLSCSALALNMATCHDFKGSLAPSAQVWEFCCCCSVAKSCPTVCDPLDQHARPPCPSLSPEVCSSSCASKQWCYPTISSSAAFFCLQSLPVF